MKSVECIRKWILPPGILDLIRKILEYKKYISMSKQDKKLLKNNLEIKGIHRGSRCFVMGTGSSINNQNIKLLKDDYVICVSKAYEHADYNIIKPKYHVLPPIINSHSNVYERRDFIEWLKEIELETENAEMFFHIGDKELISENGLFKNRIIHWFDFSYLWDGDYNLPIDLAHIPVFGSVSEIAITVALYLGFDKIYIIGFDHDWFNGLFVYFYDNEKKGMRKSKNIDHIDSEYQMRRHAEIFKKYKYLLSVKNNIYNANFDSKTYVDVFPKVNYNDLFERVNEEQ
jgi:hypothetical protein